MKAAVHTTYGPPTVIHIKDINKPTPKPDEVLIEVHASTVNRTDIGFLRANPFFIRAFSGLTKPKVTVLGTEFAGRIETVGAAVTTFAPGDRVFGFSPDTRFGAHAEYMTMREHGMMATTPAHMNCEQIAPATEGAHYALGSIRAAKVRDGSRVLVYGATGAIGTAAVQLCKHFGAYVTAVCDTARVPLVQSLGPDAVIDYTKEDFTRTAAEAYDFVLDAVGKSTFGACKPLLKSGGIYCSTDLGPMAQNPFLALATRVVGDKKLIFPLPREPKADAEFLKSLIEKMPKAAFTPVIDRTYPFDQIVEAFTYVETGQKTGNVVVSFKGK